MSPLGPFAPRREAETPDVASGQIPGLPGAPVRTPVRAGQAATSAGLWPAIAGRLITRQLWIELYGLPGYGLTLSPVLSGGKVTAFAATPRDFRPHDPAPGKNLLVGRFILAGASMEVEPPSDPWNRPSPSRPFAVELHAFNWLPALMAQGERGAREALRLALAWADAFARWSPFAWGPEILPRRVINLACAARRMGAVATEAERLRLADSLARQTRQLLRPPGGLATRAERLTAAAIGGCVLAGAPGQGLRRRALGGLAGALRVTVHDDGSHASRSPEAGLELLLDLLTLDDALAQLSEPTPQPVSEAIDRLTQGLRLLTLPDGRLAGFQGGGPSSAARVAAARAHDEAAATARAADRTHPPVGRIGGLVRIASPLLSIIADAASPARGTWGATACAQPLALEIACGKDRLVTGSGWTPAATDRQALRLTPGHSTLTLGERSLNEPLGGWKGELLGPRLVGPPIHVITDQREAEGAVWLEMEHDGWNEAFGLNHQRRLYLDQRLDELRAEEKLFPTPGRKEVIRQIAAPYAIRFHLEPGVQASLARDRRSILLRGASGRGWWFRTDGPDVAIEPSVHIDAGLTRRSLQIVVRGSARTDSESRIRWKLSPAGASGDPS
ncbi:heparinase II/III family protein [Brevundimonas aurantiaca]|uniref:heparinase II/III family protein n=1 Tax=Brevundimonas aurantiaca TaxID=74316 RepID=UPI001D18D376|nr:heparinase II/III family protein [Brevundimonas aurantiaca]MCC4293908.1 heparinase II/III family protein [Brevundimonas aurantiaca]